MLTIDESEGEGGGQMLRSSLALSMCTGLPFHMTRIRAGRAKPGLLRQHAAAVEASAAISTATVTGAHLGSTELTFVPGAVRSGDYALAVGSAGSAMGVSAESVGKRVARAVRNYVESNVPVGEYLADQLMLPIALVGGGAFATLEPSQHARTHADVIGKFLDVVVGFTQESQHRWGVQLVPRPHEDSHQRRTSSGVKEHR